MWAARLEMSGAPPRAIAGSVSKGRFYGYP